MRQHQEPLPVINHDHPSTRTDLSERLPTCSFLRTFERRGKSRVPGSSLIKQLDNVATHPSVALMQSSKWARWSDEGTADGHMDSRGRPWVVCRDIGCGECARWRVGTEYQDISNRERGGSATWQATIRKVHDKMHAWCAGSVGHGL